MMIKDHITDIYQELNTNIPSSSSSNHQELYNPSINLDTSLPQQNAHHDNTHNRKNNKPNTNPNGNNKRLTITSQTTRQKRVANPINNLSANQDTHYNNDDLPKKETTPHNNINKSASREIIKDTSRDPAGVDTQNEKHMDLDIDIIRPSWNDFSITHDVNDVQPTMNTNDIIHNPWSDPTPTSGVIIQQIPSQILDFKSVLDLRQNANFDTVVNNLYNQPLIKPYTHTSTAVLKDDKDDVDIQTVEIKETVDNSRHAPKNCKNRKTQTFDSRVLVSEIPGYSPAEKLSVLQGFFLDTNALKHIFVDEIYNSEYFILQFTNINTMRTMVRQFNSYNDYHAKMTPMTYTKSRPTDTLHSPCKNVFKVIDLDGTNNQKQLAISAVEKILRADNLQIMEDQPNIHELKFYVSSNKHTEILRDTWAIPIEQNIARLGPNSFTTQDFLNRNRWVGKSDSATSFSASRLLDNLDVIGVKNVYKQSTNKNRTYLAFDTEENYHKAIARGIHMDCTSLNILPVTSYSRLDLAKYNKGKNKQYRSRSPSPLPTPQSTPIITQRPCPTGANRTKLGQNKYHATNTRMNDIVDDNSFKSLAINPTFSS